MGVGRDDGGRGNIKRKREGIVLALYGVDVSE